MLSSVKLIRWAEATDDGVNVVYWETFAGTKHYITLSLDWYADNRLATDAMRLYCPGFPISQYTDAQREDRMYTIPGPKVKCENRSGDPMLPYE